MLGAGVEQLVQRHFGTLGVVGLIPPAIGARAHNTTCASLGAAALVLFAGRRMSRCQVLDRSFSRARSSSSSESTIRVTPASRSLAALRWCRA